MEDLQNPTPGSVTTATPADQTPAPAVAQGTVHPDGEAGKGQGAPVEESFTRIDPNTLPPQLRQFYENMNRDYKSKTQQLAEERKKYTDYDTHKQKAELYEQIASQKEFVNMWNDYVKKQGGQGGQPQQPDPTAEVKAKLEQIENKLKQSELAEVVESFSKAQGEDGELLNPDFDALNEVVIGKTQSGEEFSLLRACIELGEGKTPQERLASGYKTAKAIRDQILEEGRKQGMGKMLSKVRNSTNAPTITSDKAKFNGDPKTLSVREARELAEKRVVVH